MEKCTFAVRFMGKKITGVLIVVLWLMSGCSEYTKVMKSTDMNVKFDAALKYYNNKNFSRCLPLFEELVAYYRGTSMAERMYYYYAYSHYGLQNYELAGLHFNNYVESFPNSSKVEECSYMACYCGYMQSLPSNLDQSDGFRTIEALQLFINTWPESSYIPSCNRLLDALRIKLAEKSYQNAKLYFQIEDYRAAMVSFKNLIKDYPDTEHKEEAMFLLVKSAYLMAKNSVEDKKVERFKTVIDYYNEYLNEFPTGEKLKELKGIQYKAKAELTRITKIPQS